MTHQEQKAFQNIVGKGEIARKEQFLLFPQCFLLYHISVSPFCHIFDIISLFAVELEESKIGISDKVLRMNQLFAKPKIFSLNENEIIRRQQNECCQNYDFCLKGKKKQL